MTGHKGKSTKHIKYLHYKTVPAFHSFGFERLWGNLKKKFKNRTHQTDHVISMLSTVHLRSYMCMQHIYDVNSVGDRLYICAAWSVIEINEAPIRKLGKQSGNPIRRLTAKGSQTLINSNNWCSVVVGCWCGS